jgi:hypothetical protein
MQLYLPVDSVLAWLYRSFPTALGIDLVELQHGHDPRDLK